MTAFDGGRISSEADPLGRGWHQQRDQGQPLAGKSNSAPAAVGDTRDSRRGPYQRIAIDPEAVERSFVDIFLDRFESPPEEIVLDLDVIDVSLRGTQEERFFVSVPGRAEPR